MATVHYEHAMPLRGGELFEPAAVVAVATTIDNGEAWRPSHLAGEIERANRFCG